MSNIELFIGELGPALLILIVFVICPLVVTGVERLIIFLFAREAWEEERNERYEKYRSMFEEMKKG